MKRAMTWLCLIVIFSSIFGYSSVGAASSSDERSADRGAVGLVFVRTMDKTQTVPGEPITVTFDLINHGPDAVDYTLIEEVAGDVLVVPSDGGGYNQAAGFIVWRGQLGAGERAANRYQLRVKEGFQGVLPLYAYLSASSGVVIDSYGEITGHLLPIRLSLGSTIVGKDEATTLTLMVRNPLNDPISVDLDVQQDASVRLTQSLPGSLHLEAGEEWTWQAEMSVSLPGSHSVAVTPMIGETVAGNRSQVTLSFYEDERAHPPKDVVPDEANTPTPVITDRTHALRLPAGLVNDGETLLMTVLIPEGAGYLPGTASVWNGDDFQPVDPILRGEYLLFALPHQDYIEVQYSLRYDDKSRVNLSEEPSTESDSIGLIAYGLVPRVLKGSPQLLDLLSRDFTLPQRERQGVAVLYPRDGEVFADRDQTSIEVDAPFGVDVTLFVNGEEVPESQLGGLATDDVLERRTEQYIAVRLQSGENRITARGLTADGRALTDEITVYRSGAVTSLSMQPVTELVTGSVRPLVLQVSAADALGLPPADGTPVTVEVTGATIVSPDRHPDWVGHQLHVIGGTAYLEIESPGEATVVTVTAKIDDVTASESFVVTTKADQWFVIGQGTVRTQTRHGTWGRPLTLSNTLRLFAKGPVGRAVFTAAVDNQGLSESYGGLAPWTGDEAAPGSVGGGDGIAFARLERGLSYAQFGRGNVEFQSTLSPYNQSHFGLLYDWRESDRLTLKGFWAREPVDAIEVVFRGDGTRYYRVLDDEIKPGSERLSIVTRSATPPHQVLRETAVAPGTYRIDFRTGQIFLSDPLFPVDEEGNLLYLRVRYVPEGDIPTEDVSGIYMNYQMGLVTGKLVALRGLSQSGVAPHVAVVGGEAQFGNVSIDFEQAISHSDIGLGAATALSISHPDLVGWDVRLSHRNVGVLFVPIGRSQQLPQKGIVTSLGADRQLGLTRISATASVARDEAHAPWKGEASAGVSWRVGIAQPEIQLKATGGEATEPAMTVRGGIGLDLRRGEISLAREQSITGAKWTRDTLSGKVDLFEKTSIHASADIERRSGHLQPRQMITVGVTQLIDMARAQLKMQAGYELTAEAGLVESNLVYGTGLTWNLGERNTISVSLDQKRPLMTGATPSSGGTLTWSYRTNALDSELRLDHAITASGTKQSVRWTGSIPIGQAFRLRADTLLSVDEANQRRQKIGLSGVYRGDRWTLLGNLTSDVVDASFKRAPSTEWWFKAAWRMTPDISLSAGYARRQTASPTTSDKTHAGIVWTVNDKTAVLLEASWLKQYDTATSLTGTMIGISYEIAKDLWLTTGYAAADYVGFDLSGDAFSRPRSGLFVELGFTFDEMSVYRLFPRFFSR